MPGIASTNTRTRARDTIPGMGDIAELVATIGMGAFYCISFLATAALVEVGYMITRRFENRKRIRAWLRKR